jgi:hypothetical protein
LEATEVEIDIDKIAGVIGDALTNGPASCARAHGVPQSYVGGMLSLARKIGAIPKTARAGGERRKYDPADVVAALAAKPLPDVMAQFGLSAATLLKIDADARKATKASGSAAAGGEAVQAAA